MTPYRILQLTSTSDIGGTESMLLHLLRHVDRSKFQVEVGSLIGSGLLTERAGELGIESWNLAMANPLDPRGIATLYKKLRRRRFDLVQLYGLRAETLGRPLARLAGMQAIISSIRSPDPWRRARHIWLDRLTAPLVTRWVSNSEAGRQSRITRERFPADRIVTILNGIPLPPAELAASPTAAERAAFEHETGIAPDDGPLVAYVANLRRMKGHLDLIAALPEVLKTAPNLKVICAGRDDSDGEIPRLARERGVDHALRFIGFCSDTPRLVRHCDFLLLPSLWEGCPVSIMEAMALGRPVVASAVGGIPELVEHDREGLLIPPGDPVALGRALLQLANDPGLRAAMGAAARRRAERDFSVEQMTRRIEAVWLSVLDSGRRDG